MAFIGPRPERKFYIDQILEHDKRYTYLYQIRPGVTSYALSLIHIYTAKDAVRQYRSTAHFINGKLKELGKRLGLGMPLTMYVARHAWADVYKRQTQSLP